MKPESKHFTRRFMYLALTAVMLVAAPRVN